MSSKIEVARFGGPEVLDTVNFDLPAPSIGELSIRHTAIGLNFIDCYHRSGLYPVALPFVPGTEAAGLVEAVGEGVSGFSVGDRIICGSAMGAYTTHRNLPTADAFHIPDYISDEQAASLYLKGLTAHFLLKSTYEVTEKTTLLAYAATGGVGTILTTWAKSMGATVIAVVGNEEKATIAKANGCDLVLVDGRDDIVAKTRAFTNGQGVDVVYDSIGKDTFEQSLDCLRLRGLMVSFGNASGPVAMPSLGILAAKGSLYVTRPTGAGYFPDRESRQLATDEMFAAFHNGEFKLHIGQTYDLADIQSAHRDIEARKTTGATIIRP